MGISVSDLNAFVSHSVCNRHRRETHVDQQADVAMTNIMDPYALDPGGFCTSVHFPVQIALGDGENAVFLFQSVLHLEELLHFLTEKIRHLNGAVAFGHSFLI